jgi:hypothetical protein
LTTKRLVFAGLDPEGYPVNAQELLDGTWQPVSTDVYNSIPSDLYLVEESAGSDDMIWTDGDNFAYDTCVDAGSPPSADEAEKVYEAYLLHLRSQDENAQLTGLIFVYEAAA